MVFTRRPAAVLTAIVAACAMAISLTACTTDANSQDTADDQTTVTSSAPGVVAMFTPSDGITLNQQTPLNKWAKLTPNLTKALTSAGFKKGDISHTTSDSLDKQSRAIQDYVVNHLSGSNTTDDAGIVISPDNITLLVAPVVEADASPPPASTGTMSARSSAPPTPLKAVIPRIRLIRPIRQTRRIHLRVLIPPMIRHPTHPKRPAIPRTRPKLKRWIDWCRR